MQLFFSPNSPYARKCRVVALEKGLEGRVSFVKTDPWDNMPQLMAANPLGMVPALIADDGTALCDSKIICEYLDSLSLAMPLFPADKKERFSMLSFAVLADGIIDASVACVIETLRRPEDKRWAGWIERKENAIHRSLEVIAGHALDTKAPPNIALITLGVALSYVSFRMPHIDWRSKHPVLASWYDTIAQRPSFVATAPVA